MDKIDYPGSSKPERNGASALCRLRTGIGACHRLEPVVPSSWILGAGLSRTWRDLFMPQGQPKPAQVGKGCRVPPAEAGSNQGSRLEAGNNCKLIPHLSYRLRAGKIYQQATDWENTFRD